MNNAREEIQILLNTLPLQLKNAILKLEQYPGYEIINIIEISVDLGRHPIVRYLDGTGEFPKVIEIFDHITVSESDLKKILSSVKNTLKEDNRTGIDNTLHRISALVDRYNNITGLTLRVGKDIPGTEWAFTDLLENNKNILIIGQPGQGKTSSIRGIAKYCADTLLKRTIIVDESDEIAGHGKIPHSSVGMARKISVPSNKSQDEMLLQAVQNHTPETILADEIGNGRDVMAILSVSNRGVQIIATSHGEDILSVIKNPHLNLLLGSIKTVTVGDSLAKIRGTNKSIKERQYDPVFDTIVVLKSHTEVAVYHNATLVIDSILSDSVVFPEERVRDGDKFVITKNQKIKETKETKPTPPEPIPVKRARR